MDVQTVASVVIVAITAPALIYWLAWCVRAELSGKY